MDKYLSYLLPHSFLSFIKIMLLSLNTEFFILLAHLSGLWFEVEECLKSWAANKTVTYIVLNSRGWSDLSESTRLLLRLTFICSFFIALSQVHESHDMFEAFTPHFFYDIMTAIFPLEFMFARELKSVLKWLPFDVMHILMSCVAPYVIAAVVFNTMFIL